MRKAAKTVHSVPPMVRFGPWEASPLVERFEEEHARHLVRMAPRVPARVGAAQRVAHEQIGGRHVGRSQQGAEFTGDRRGKLTGSLQPVPARS